MILPESEHDGSVASSGDLPTVRNAHPLPPNEIRQLKRALYLVLCLLAPFFIGVALLGNTAHKHIATWYAAFAIPLSILAIIFALKRVWDALPPKERRLQRPKA